MVLPYSEGSWFAVPLRNGGYAIGVIARMAPQGRIVFGYFFGPKRNVVPQVLEVDGLCAGSAALSVRVGDLGLIKGEWPVIGRATHWSRDDWPMPSFVRRDPLSNRALLIRYKDSNPGEVESESPLLAWDRSEQEDGLCGYGSVEKKLTNLLGS